MISVDCSREQTVRTCGDCKQSFYQGQLLSGHGEHWLHTPCLLKRCFKFDDLAGLPNWNALLEKVAKAACPLCNPGILVSPGKKREVQILQGEQTSTVKIGKVANQISNT